MPKKGGPRKKTRKFGGEEYRYAGWSKTKRQAKKHAKEDRKEGYKARVVKHKGQYTIYRKRK